MSQTLPSQRENITAPTMKQEAGSFFERRPWFLFGILTVFTIPWLAAAAVRRPVWFDEIYSISLAHLTVKQLWSALATTVDQQPPLSYILMRGSILLFGDNSLAARLQSTAGFWLMAAAIFRFVSFRTGAVWAFLAALMPFATDIIYFGAEARPYGLMMGLSAAALASWQSAAAYRSRRAALVCLVAAIVLDVSTQYYAVLMVLPLLAGEAVRTWERRKIDWPVVLASTIPFGFVWIYLPFVAQSIRIYGPNPWNAPMFKSLWVSYQYVLGGTAPIFWAVPVACFFMLYRFSPREEQRTAEEMPPLHDSVAALALAALPGPAYIVAVAKTHMLYPRYVLPLVAGCAILFAFALWRLTRGRALLGLAASACLMIWITVLQTENVLWMPEPMFGCPAAPASGPTASLPVVVDDAWAFLRCWYYAKPPLKDRLFFVSDPVAAASIGRDNSTLTNLLIARDVLHFPVVRYTDFKAAHPQFLLSKGVGGEANWVLTKYLKDHARVEILDKFPWDLYLVSDRGSEKNQ